MRKANGTPPRASPYNRKELLKSSPFPQEWFDTALRCLSIARSARPVIVPVTEFRDTIGVALTNIAGGGDVAGELKRATEAFQPVLTKSNES